MTTLAAAEQAATTKVRFGIFDWIDRGEAPLHQLYEERLQFLEAADAAGFYCYHLAEHHATPLGMAPSPALFLTAAAQRTRRIRLGPLVYLLPLYDPLRLIEEVCMLDQISKGRLDLGVGRGVSPYELAYFGVDPANSRAIFDEALAALVAGLTSKRLNFSGERHRYENVPIELQPLQQPYPPLWYPTTNPGTMPWVAAHGFNFVGLGPNGLQRACIDAYRQSWEEHKDDPDRINGHVASPMLGVVRQIVVAPTDEEAMSIAHTAHRHWNRSILQLWHEHDDHSNDPLFDWDGMLASGMLIAGSPARVREQFAAMFAETGANYLVCAFTWGGVSQDQALRSLRLFSEEVMPQLSQSAGVAAL